MATLWVHLISLFLIPLLLLEKTSIWFGYWLDFLTVILLAGLYELSKVRRGSYICLHFCLAQCPAHGTFEQILESPFHGIPNDLASAYLLPLDATSK